MATTRRRATRRPLPLMPAGLPDAPDAMHVRDVMDVTPAPRPSHAPDAPDTLDDPSEWPGFGRALDADPCGRWESQVSVDGMFCAACALTLESVLTRLPGIEQVEASAANASARIVWDARLVTPSRWFAASAGAGYQLTPVFGSEGRRQRRQAQRLTTWRLLVALLCMMQVMMYAYPTYVTEAGEIAPDLVSLLRWASWVLTLPVIFFCCPPFFRQCWRDLRHRRIGMDLPVSLGIVAAFGVSSIATFDPGGPFGQEVYFDSLTMFVCFLLTGRWLEAKVSTRSAEAIETLLSRLPQTVEKLLPDGTAQRIAIRRLVVGDRLRVYPGETFPADGVLLQGQTLVDESILTGESKPLSRQQPAAVLAGSHNLTAPVLMRVDALGADTRYGQIRALMQAATTHKPRAARLADRLVTPFLVGVLIAAAASAAYWWNIDTPRAIQAAIAVLIVTCPCALSLATPSAMLASAAAMARRAILVLDLQALERIASVDTVIFDKTGTLTTGVPMLSDIRSTGRLSDAHVLALAAQIARQSLHPASRAIVAAGELAAFSAGAAPADLLTSIEHPGQGIEAWLTSREGSAASAWRVRLGSAAFCGMPAHAEESTGSIVHLSDDTGPLAKFFIVEDLRRGAIDTVRRLTAAGIVVHIVSGDREQVVQSLARRLGISNAAGGCSPHDKLQRIAALQQAGRRVAMVGDGINDAPSLARAFVSFAMGKAVPMTQARADFVVLAGDLSAIADTVDIGRRTLRVISQNLVWALLYNAVCIPLALAGWMPPWLAGLGMASSSLIVVLNAARLARPSQAVSGGAPLKIPLEIPHGIPDGIARTSR